MWSIWSIIFDSLGGILLAIVLSFVGVCLFMVLIGVLVGMRSMGFRAALGVPLWILVAIQSMLLAGAITVKGYVDDAGETIDAVIGMVQTDTTATSNVIDAVCDKVPIVPKLVNVEDLRNIGASELSAAIVDKMKETVHDYMMRRLYWITGFCVVTFILVLIIPGNTQSTNNRSNRAERLRPGAQNLRRASRARR